MKRLILRMILYSYFGFIFSCGFFTKSQDQSKKQSELTSAEISTGSTYCDHGIEDFNMGASARIMSDISFIKSKKGDIPEDLKLLYPSARDTWNSSLRRIKNQYTKDYKVSLPPLSTDEMKDWRNKNLEDYKKFFLLLTEYKYGRYPTNTYDMEKIAGWREKADISKRLDAYISVFINNNCNSVHVENIRQKLNPMMLPEKIEDSLQ